MEIKRPEILDLLNGETRMCKKRLTMDVFARLECLRVTIPAPGPILEPDTFTLQLPVMEHAPYTGDLFSPVARRHDLYGKSARISARRIAVTIATTCVLVVTVAALCTMPG